MVTRPFITIRIYNCSRVLSLFAFIFFKTIRHPSSIHAKRSQHHSPISYYYHPKTMSLALNSFRPIAHASITRGAPALLLRASFHAQSRRGFVRRTRPKAVTVVPTSRIRQVPNQYCIATKYFYLIYREKPKELKTPWYWRLYCMTMVLTVLTSLYVSSKSKFVLTVG
jgi:hypothetical protein